MNAIKDLLASERGLVCTAALICATVMFGIGHLTEATWLTFMQWVLVTYVSGKTASSIAETVTRGKVAAATTDTATTTTPATPT